MSSAAHQLEVRRVVATLQRYLDTKPDHRHGLCYWLSERVGRQPFHAYSLISDAAEAGHIKLSPSRYVCDQTGYQPERADLARHLIALLQSGKLTLPWVE